MGEQENPVIDSPAGTLGPRLREARTEKGYSLRQFAGRVGISASGLSQIETSKSAPSVNTLYAIVSELGLSLDQLFATEDGDEAEGESPPRDTTDPDAVAGDPRWEVPGADLDAEAAERLRREAPDEWPVQRRERRAILQLDTGVTWERLTAEDDPGVDFIVSVYAPGGASAPEGALVRHGGHEYHVVVRGELTVTLGFKSVTLRPGDSISFDSFEPHMLANSGSEPTEVISAVVGRTAGARAVANGGS